MTTDRKPVCGIINSLPLTYTGKICKNLPMIMHYILNQRPPFSTKLHYSQVFLLAQVGDLKNGVYLGEFKKRHIAKL
jgi:hypothetical protein